MAHSGPVFEAGNEPGQRARPTATQRSAQVVKAGASLGTVLAVTISWSVNHSILWAIFHGILSWIYVIYYALTR
jgi:hypothetical protein